MQKKFISIKRGMLLTRLCTFLYDVTLLIFALFALPKFFYLWLVRKKYRTSLAERLGIGFPAISDGGPLIWIHAVSVGETRAIAPLAKLIKNRLPNARILISSVTETGHAEAKRSLPFAEAHVYMPLDFRWVIAPLVRKVKPTLVLLSESDFWLNFLTAVKEEGGATFLVNGKLSAKSMRRFAALPWFSRSLFNLIDVFCVQNTHYAERFAKVGVPSAKIYTTGNLKFDDHLPKMAPDELQKWRERLGVAPEDLVLVIGSSHAPEEQFFFGDPRPPLEPFSPS
jgi:3-deoxy-D-manno-octulosonic-acid transferase